MERLFEFLFKYRPLVYEQGDFALGAPASVRAWVLAAGAVAAVAAVSYTLTGGRASRLERGVMAGLRGLLVATLVFALLQPVLVISTVVPQQNFVGILIDDSRSMALPGTGDAPRAAFVADAFTPGESELLQRLSDRFVLRFFRFSDHLARIDGPAELTFQGTRTDLAAALDGARAELAGVPLSGLVVVSDGAHNGTRSLTEALVPLQAQGTPVFTVGLGEEAVTPDVELGRVEMPRTALEGSALLVDVVVTQWGLGGRTVPLLVEDGERLLAEESVELGDDGEPVVTRVRIRLERPGARRLRFQIPPQEGERVTENNTRDVLIEVRGEREKILYFEGEPRHELKFMRRAVEDDPNIQLVTLLRTADRKFYRLAIDDSTELEFGFPASRQELYRYRGLVLGSVEASFFSHDQLNMIAEFVSERGGGVLFLGGRNAFAEGGWGGTPVEEVMPVVLDEPGGGGGDDGFFAEVRVRPTPAGLGHPAVQLDREGAAVGPRWDSLPPVTTVNPIRSIRAGATALLTGEGPGLPAPQVVLAFQRYGSGKAAALTVQDTWLWQMHADIPVEDQRHELFWQQLLRWLVDGVPDPVRAVAEVEEPEPGRPLRVVTTVRDSTFIEVNDADVRARVVGPDGDAEEVPLAWTIERDGVYEASITPDAEGEYVVEVEATRDGRTLGVDTLYVHVAPSNAEYFSAGRRTQLLERLARDTGGRSYTPGNVQTLPEDIAVTGAGVTLVERLDLWDMPALFLLMLLLMGAEWGMRRWRGLV